MAKSLKTAAAVAVEPMVAEEPPDPPVSEEVPAHSITSEKLDEAAQAMYAAITTHHDNQQPRSTTAGTPFDPWMQLTENQREGYRQGAYAILGKLPEEDALPRAIALTTLEESAQALYSGLVAPHGGNYPETVRLGDPFDPWSLLPGNIKAGYHNAAFAALSSVPPDPPKEDAP